VSNINRRFLAGLLASEDPRDCSWATGRAKAPDCVLRTEARIQPPNCCACRSGTRCGLWTDGRWPAFYDPIEGRPRPVAALGRDRPVVPLYVGAYAPVLCRAIRVRTATEGFRRGNRMAPLCLQRKGPGVQRAFARPLQQHTPSASAEHTVDTWLILPVVICLSQRLSHACLSISKYTAKLRMAH
jgi:hypothetical protein